MFPKHIGVDDCWIYHLSALIIHAHYHVLSESMRQYLWLDALVPHFVGTKKIRWKYVDASRKGSKEGKHCS